MPLNILTTQTTGKTLFASLERLSDGFFWNVTTSAWANNPAAADRKVTLTEGSGANAGSYTASVSGLGDAADIRARVHDDADAADKTISAAVAYVWGGNEVPKATDASGNALAKDSDVTAIKAKTDNLPLSPAAVGSAMTLAADAVNAAALATDAVAEIAAKITTDHGSGSYVDSGAGGDATLANQTAILARIGSARIVSQSPISDTSLTLHAGIDYDAADSEEVSVTKTGKWATYSGGTLALQVVSESTYTTAAQGTDVWASATALGTGTITQSGSDAILKVSIPRADVDALNTSPPDNCANYRYRLAVTQADGDVLLAAKGSATVVR